MSKTRLDTMIQEKANSRVLIFKNKEEAKETIHHLDPSIDLKNLFNHHYVSRNTLSFSYEIDLFDDYMKEPIYENDIYYMIHKQDVEELRRVNPLEFGLVRKFSDEEIEFLIDNLTDFQISLLKSNFYRHCKLLHYEKLWERFRLNNTTYRYTSLNLRVNGDIMLILVRQELMGAYILKHLRYLQDQKPNSILTEQPKFNINTMTTMTKRDLTSYLEVPISLLRLKGDQTSKLAYDLESCRIEEMTVDKEYYYSVDKVRKLLLSKYKQRGNNDKIPEKLPDEGIYQLNTLFNELDLSSYFVSVHSLNNSMADRVSYYELAPKVFRYNKEDVVAYVKQRVREYHLAIQNEKEENIFALDAPKTTKQKEEFEKEYDTVENILNALTTTALPNLNYKITFQQIKTAIPRYYLLDEKEFPIVTSAKANENTYYKYDEFNSILNEAYGYWNKDFTVMTPCTKEEQFDIRKHSFIASHNLYDFYQSNLKYTGAYTTFKKKSAKAIKSCKIPCLVIGKKQFYCTEFLKEHPNCMIEN